MTTLPETNERTMATAVAQPGQEYWPEAVRNKPRTDRFPWLTLLLGLLPGIIAVLLLIFPLLSLLDQAQRDIAFVSTDGRLNVVQADLNNQRSISAMPFQLDAQAQQALGNVAPVLGLPQWSPDGIYLATTVISNGRSLPSVFSSISGTATILSPAATNTNHFLVPGDGWVADGSLLALLEVVEERPFLTIADFSQPSPVFTSTRLALDTRAGFDWRPDGQEILATVLPDSSAVPTVRIIGLDGRSRPFIPNQNQFLADAVWSPVDNSVAYIVVKTGQSPQSNMLAGELWIAGSDGVGARQLVAEGLNTAPIWHSSDPSHIYFTRFVTTTNAYDLYRVNLFGQSQPERVGPSSAALIQYPFDRQHFVAWSEDDIVLTISGEPLPVVSAQGKTLDSVLRTIIRGSIPVLGGPSWSPDGRFLATTQWQNGQVLPALYDANLQRVAMPKSDLKIVAVPSDGWSEDGLALALVGYDGKRPLLTLLSQDFARSQPFTFTLDSRAGISWSPLEPKLLATIYTNNAPTPALLIVDPNGGQQLFNPADSRLVHADGVWSPDGSQIAYVAADTYTTTQNILAGELWLADATGSNPRPLVTDAQVIAPLWNPTGDMIYFTRYNGPAGQFALYRVAVSGSMPPEYIGPGSEAILLYPFDRSALIQWTPDTLQLMFVGQTALISPQYIATIPDSTAVTTIQTRLPVLGNGRWSPNKDQFAGTVLNPADGAVRVGIFKSPADSPLFSPATTDWIVMPADGWSSNGRYVALLRHDGINARLSVLDTEQISMGTGSFILDTRAGLSWRPASPQVMVTERMDNITPTLRIYQASDGSVSPFAPDDSQIVRADGAWSPDGRLVTYIAHDNITDTLGMDFLAGSLWVADSNGRQPRELIAEGLNFAPLWSSDATHILFTRYVTETSSFELYQIDLEGENLEPLGASAEQFARFPFDRSAFWRWSPDGQRWLLPGADTPIPFIYYTTSGTTAVTPLSTGCAATSPHVVRWAPTNRGALIACPDGQTVLHWTDRERDDKSYPNGLYPAWQP